MLTSELRPRAREIGIEIGELKPGRYNAITDVEGVKVGHVTLIKGEGALKPGVGPVRTGVTSILPHIGNVFKEKIHAGVFVLNGFGKSVGLIQITELGTIETPILLTNTLNVGIVMDALIEYMLNLNPDIGVTTTSVNPIVCECNDSFLNDIRGRHVKHRHVFESLKNAHGERVEEGSVGAGTGMSTYGFKGGIGTSSRILEKGDGRYTVGALVLSNFGRKDDLRIDGVPVGRELKEYSPVGEHLSGSVIVVLATDAPLNSRQLRRVARRGCHGIARTGSYSSHGSGDIIIAFTTKNKIPHYAPHKIFYEFLSEDSLNPIFKAAAEATEEAIVNSMFKAEIMVGRDGNVRYGIPIDDVLKIMKRYGRI